MSAEVIFKNAVSNVQNIVYSDAVGVPTSHWGVGVRWGRLGTDHFHGFIVSRKI